MNFIGNTAQRLCGIALRKHARIYGSLHAALSQEVFSWYLPLTSATPMLSSAAFRSSRFYLQNGFLPIRTPHLWSLPFLSKQFWKSIRSRPQKSRAASFLPWCPPLTMRFGKPWKKLHTATWFWWDRVSKPAYRSPLTIRHSWAATALPMPWQHFTNTSRPLSLSTWALPQRFPSSMPSGGTSAA